MRGSTRPVGVLVVVIASALVATLAWGMPVGFGEMHHYKVTFDPGFPCPPIETQWLEVNSSPVDPLGFSMTVASGYPDLESSGAAGIWGTVGNDGYWAFWFPEGTGVQQNDANNLSDQPATLKVDYIIDLVTDTEGMYAGVYDIIPVSGNIAGPGDYVSLHSQLTAWSLTLNMAIGEVELDYYNDTPGTYYAEPYAEWAPDPAAGDVVFLPPNDTYRFIGTVVFTALDPSGGLAYTLHRTDPRVMWLSPQRHCFWRSASAQLRH